MTEKQINQVLIILREINLVNPPIVSDGHGEYSDIHKIGESDLEEIEEELKKL